MKKKLFLTMLCSIGLCLILACSMDFDTTATTVRDLGNSANESEQQFFKNQNRSFSILDEAMSPFRTEASGIYCESFAGVFIDENGNLNIGVVPCAITEQAEIAMTSLINHILYINQSV